MLLGLFEQALNNLHPFFHKTVGLGVSGATRDMSESIKSCQILEFYVVILSGIVGDDHSWQPMPCKY